MELVVGFCCFSRPGAETQLRPRCYLYGLVLKGMVIQGPAWDSHDATLQPLVTPLGSIPHD